MRGFRDDGGRAGGASLDVGHICGRNNNSNCGTGVMQDCSGYSFKFRLVTRRWSLWTKRDRHSVVLTED